MGIRIDERLCQGCGSCLSVCPGDLLSIQDHLARIAEPGRCWSCAACLKSCPHGALGLSLSPSQGGRGLILTVIGEEPPGSDGDPPGCLKWRAACGSFIKTFTTRRGRGGGY